MTRRALLAGGIASSILYAVLTVYCAAQWPGYSQSSQTISELSAVGAPTRSLWVPPAVIYTLLVTGFGWGIVLSARGDRASRVRMIGRLVIAYGALGVVWPLAPMHLRETLAAGGATFSDTLHITLASVTVVIMVAAVGLGATTFGKGFRAYSIGSLALLFLFGALTFVDAPKVSVNLPTPWIGVWERINVGVFLLWVTVVAVRLWPAAEAAAAADSSHRPALARV